jgi:hypothetical protein
MSKPPNDFLQKDINLFEKDFKVKKLESLHQYNDCILNITKYIDTQIDLFIEEESLFSISEEVILQVQNHKFAIEKFNANMNDTMVTFDWLHDAIPTSNTRINDSAKEMREKRNFLLDHCKMLLHKPVHL